MSYKLQYPYTVKEKSDFIVEYNHNKGLRIEQVEEVVLVNYVQQPEIIDPDTQEVIQEEIIGEKEETHTIYYALEPWEKIIDGEVVDNSEEYQQQQAQAEQERINKLTMTALDLINLIKSQGVDDMTIYQYLQENIALNLQLTYCQNVYCGVVRQLLPLTVGGVTITDDLIVNAFKIKNGEQTTQNTIENRVEEN